MSQSDVGVLAEANVVPIYVWMGRYDIPSNIWISAEGIVVPGFVWVG